MRRGRLVEVLGVSVEILLSELVQFRLVLLDIEVIVVFCLLLDLFSWLLRDLLLLGLLLWFALHELAQKLRLELLLGWLVVLLIDDGSEVGGWLKLRGCLRLLLCDPHLSRNPYTLPSISIK